MAREKKMVYISERAHGGLKLLAARQKRPMGEVLEELVAQELSEMINPWIAQEGLALQQKVLAQIWEDPMLDLYEPE